MSSLRYGILYTFEGRDGIDMGEFTGNQKWRMRRLGRFLDMLDGGSPAR